VPLIKRIGVLTGGGDAPGLNAVIRAVVKSAFNAGIEVVGLEDSFDGLLDPSRSRVLTPKDVTGILRFGGTILGTTNHGNPFEYPVDTPEGKVDYSDRVVETFHKMGLQALVVIGGDGSLSIAHQFYLKGIPVVGVPKTIDNDIVGTNSCFGFDTAVAFAADAIDRLHTTAEAHKRIMVVEVMGRHAGWIALQAGLAGGADVILLPEIPYDLGNVVAAIRKRESFGAKFSIVVVAEGAKPVGGSVTLREGARPGYVERLGGVGIVIAAQLEEMTKRESRCVVLGHLQRGGGPTAFDRVLATRYGGAAVELIQRGVFGKMVANNPPDIVPIPLSDVVGRTKTVPLDSDMIKTARAIGVALGD
jgi:phosphofructokinase-like protein